jgi:hypothetical protein
MKILVYGAGVVVGVDMDDLHQRKCIGWDDAEAPGSDYELWTPMDGCLFGRRTTYVRRKREAQCYNPQTLDRVVSEEACTCGM